HLLKITPVVTSTATATVEPFVQTMQYMVVQLAHAAAVVG
ncbi:MAG: hypothetical protein ACJAS1_007076, partial [Oleiphilaceae bacterium]